MYFFALINGLPSSIIMAKQSRKLALPAQAHPTRSPKLCPATLSGRRRVCWGRVSETASKSFLRAGAACGSVAIGVGVHLSIWVV